MTQGFAEGTQIELGHAMITMVEPTRDAHDLAEYNRWYEFDHAYSGVMVGPGAFSFRRWVATRALKDLRVPSASSIADPVDQGSFIAAYFFLDGTVDEHFKWSFGEMPKLVEAGRMNPNRTHVNTSLYDFVGSANRPGWPVGAHLALDHPYDGMAGVWVDLADGASLADLQRWIISDLHPSVMPAGGSIAQALSFAPRDMPGVAGSGVGVGSKVLSLYFIQGDPRNAWSVHFAGIGDRIAKSGLGSLGLAAPFVPVIPGTDTYLDQLW